MMDAKAVESKLNDVTVTAIPMTSQHQYQQHHNQQQHQQLQITNKMQLTQQQIKQLQQLQQQNLIMPTQHSAQIIESATTRVSADITTPFTSVNSIPSSVTSSSSLSKYAQLLAVIEEMGRDIRPTYSGSRSSAERLKRGIVHARILVRECLVETERSARQ